MGKLRQRLEKIEKKASHGTRQLHVITWDVQRETDEAAKDRYLASNPGVEIRSTDLCILVKKFCKSDCIERNP